MARTLESAAFSTSCGRAVRAVAPVFRTGWVRYDGGLRMWTGPFAMAGINTRVVRRSNALQGWAYGRRFRYREVTGFGAGPAEPAS